MDETPMKYVKKPIVVEAFQFGVDEEPEWFIDKIRVYGEAKIGEIYIYDPLQCSIETLEGRMYANVGDMIIKGIQGEIYPCKKDIFDTTYEFDVFAENIMETDSNYRRKAFHVDLNGKSLKPNAIIEVSYDGNCFKVESVSEE